MSGGSTGERPFTDVITSIRYWLIHAVTIPALFVGGFVFVYNGAAYEIFGTPRPSEYFTVNRVDIPVLRDRRRVVQELEELSSLVSSEEVTKTLT